MKREPQFLPPRQCVIYEYTRRMIRETGTNLRSFAMEIADRYLQITAEDDRGLPFRVTRGGNLEADKKHNGQILGRYLDGNVKAMPADLEDAWVLSLPEPYRSDCERDLARRRGHLCVRLETGDDSAVSGVAQISTEFGELLGAIAPALADGRINEADRVHALQILNKSDDLISAVLSVRRSITALLPEGDRTHA